MTIDEYLSRLLDLAGVTISQIDTEDSDEELFVHLEIPEEDAGRVIGYRGEGLAAIQRITRIVFHEELAEKRLVIDINDYRQRRQEQLQEMAVNAAHQVLETGDDYVFPYLPSYERFIVHTTINEQADFSELETFSEGEGRDRRLVVALKPTEA